MTVEKDPRIEAVAKLLFTGPIYQYSLEQWDDPNWLNSDRRECLMAAEDVLRGIDEASGWVYGWQHPLDPPENTIPAKSEEAARDCAHIVEGTAMRARPVAWEPLP